MEALEPIWKLNEAVGKSLDFDGCELALSPMMRRLLVSRGIPEGSSLSEYLKPRLSDLRDPFELPGMVEAVDRLMQAVAGGEKVCIYGDYDVDGVSSVVLLRRLLEAYGLEVVHFVPQRGREGYGLSVEGVERALKQASEVSLLVTVDCGTASVAEIETLYQRGIEVIVIDHHEPSTEGLPQCCAIVNPKLGDDLHYLCAAGVVFKLAHAMMKRHRVEGFDLKEQLDLTALATIADIVPLVGENRLLVRHGLRQISRTTKPGLRAIARLARLNLGQPLTGQDVGFRLGPRINAAGRMDQPEAAVELLMAETVAQAERVAQDLDEHNCRRQRYEQQIREHALEMLREYHDPVNDSAIVLGSREWHPGVVGIVASRLMRQFHKPTFIISIDEAGIGKGSGRSIPGISLVSAIHASNGLLMGGGGHAMAAGISLEERHIDEFRRIFQDYVARHLTRELGRPVLNIDAEVDFAELDLDLLTQYELLQPFGNGNPQPILVSREVYLSDAPQHLKNKHLKLQMRQGGVQRDAIFFGGGESPLPNPPWDVAYTIHRNCFRGHTSLQIVVEAIAPTGQALK